MVATGMEGVGAMLLSMVTVRLPGTLGAAERWAWLEAGAGAMRRLGMGDFICRKAHTHIIITCHSDLNYRKSSNSGLNSIKGRSLIMAGGGREQIKAGFQYGKLLVPVIHH